MDITSLKTLNETFRSITQSNSISPDTVATLLNRIIEMLGTAKSESEVVNMLSNYVTKTGLSAQLSNFVTTNVLQTYYYNKAQLDNKLALYATIAQLKQLETKVNNIDVTASASASTGGAATAHISCTMQQGKLYVEGAATLLAKGYKPYILRYTRKHNRLNDVDGDKMHGPMQKGWMPFGREDTVRIDSDNNLWVLNADKIYSNTPAAFFSSAFMRLENEIKSDTSSPLYNFAHIGFGRRHRRFHRGSHTFRLAVVFTRKQSNYGRFDFSRVVSNMAEFKIHAFIEDSEVLCFRYSL